MDNDDQIKAELQRNLNLLISIRMFSAETTGPVFTKILHDTVSLVVLFNHAYTRHIHGVIPFRF